MTSCAMPAAWGAMTPPTATAQALMSALAREAHRRDWSVVRWITAEDNYRARALYDRVAVKTAWLTYDMQPAP